MAELRVLGPVEVWDGRRRIDAGQPRQRAVLAGLLVDAGRPVAVASLIDRVWGPNPPNGARQSLHAHIARIRRLLRSASLDPVAAELIFESGCYRLSLDVSRVDLHAFGSLVRQARDARHDQQRVGLLQRAVALRRGAPLAGLRGEWIELFRRETEQRFVDATVACAQAELRLGNPDAAIEATNRLTADHPLAEPLVAIRMRALAAAHRPADALTQYDDIRRLLATELGADPSRELQALHQAILRGEQQVSPAAVQRVEPSVKVVAPAQLPADVGCFAGRADHLAFLDDVLARKRSSGAAMIAALSGIPGVGKTTLAVRWSHTVAGQFPDGQLYLDLRGHDATDPVMPTAAALRCLLDGLGVPAGRLPVGMDAQVALYRSLTAGRRVLVLLDNARNAEQVRPLLPASGAAVVIVTSRDRLTGLVVRNGAHPLNLDVLPDDEARELLSHRIGAARVGAEPEAVDQIIAACARLPLALAITAARAQQTGFPLRSLAAELGRSGDPFDIGDAAGQVRGAFSASYVALGDPAQQLFRVLSRHPGEDLSVGPADGLGGLSVPTTRRLLAELVQANMLMEPRSGRFAFHDVLRAYAAGLHRTGDTDA